MRVNNTLYRKGVPQLTDNRIFRGVLLLSFLLWGCALPSVTEDEAEAGLVVSVEASALTAANESDDVATRVASDQFSPEPFTARSAECCSGPGHITECWLADAEDDDVTCEEDADCPSDECDTDLGLCVCENDSECNDGVCTDDNRCGPSWCNGYRMCSCWGGCERVDGDQSYASLCLENAMSCCEGTYPVYPDARGRDDSGLGYCSNCDDGNPCTIDKCDGRGGCIHMPGDGACDDGRACTENDSCTSGRCAGEPVRCSDENPCTDDRCDETLGCVSENNTSACDDGDACTLDDRCEEGVCTAGAGRSCEDGNPCTDDICDVDVGCVYVLNDDPCDDLDACTRGEYCVFGVCGGGVPVDCEDGNLCTDDSCDPLQGCVNNPNRNLCDDKNACTEGDICQSGVCVGGDPIECDDENICTDDSCIPASGCVFVNNAEPCDDGNACSFGDVCEGGICVATPLECNDSNLCTDDLCGEDGCEYAYNSSGCDDQNPCTSNDRCSVGGCAGVLIYWRFEESDADNADGIIRDWVGNYPAQFENTAYTVPDGKKGRAGWFGPGNGSHVGKATTDYHVYDNSHTLAFWVKFDDVTAGNQAIGSSSGAGKRFYLGIDGDNQIFAGYGNAFVGFSHDSVASTISSGEWVRMAMSFDGEQAHVYVNGEALISFDARFVGGGVGPEFFLGTGVGNVTIDEVIVDERYWDAHEIALDYDDGDGPDVSRYVVDCDDRNPCTDDSCDKDEGCVHTANAASCDDRNACTENDVCQNGVCGGSFVACDDGNFCTDDACDPSLGCLHDNNTIDCDDANACTVEDVCEAGACGGETIVCDDKNPCTDDTCDPSSGCQFANNTASCDDRNLCTDGDVCASGTCSGLPLDCDDGVGCTQDSCNPETGCVNEPLDPCPGCIEDVDCEGEITCPAQPSGCTTLACVSGECVCNPVLESTSCNGYDIAEYPPNCYAGLCDVLGACRPVMGAAENNLCSDLFEVGDSSQVDTTSSGWIGEFVNTQSSGLLNITGSTLCANNNYYAGGDECSEHSTGRRIGTDGPDLVYAFRYQTNRSDQFELFSYVIKAQADFDVGIYIKSDITDAATCPEGNVPELDSHAQTYMQAASERCAHPYRNAPMPPVVEDECRDNGNELYRQDCCDPCTSGSNCGYKWCKRGYNYNGTACDMCQNAGGQGYDSMTHKGNCDALWTYPEDPYDCDSELPEQTGYNDYDYVASAVISPDGAADGSTRTVFIFVDGVTASQGNFYLTVEKRRWWAGPCDRVDDDGRVYDITRVGAAGETFQGTLENAVNSVHGSGGSCGGYGCEGTFAGKSSCHGSGDASAFWPNQEMFKIHRQPGTGAGTYCITTDESISGGADLVMKLTRRRSTEALTICDESYESFGCARNNIGGNIQWQVAAAEDDLYLIEVSQYQRINRVCTPSQGDNCLYRFEVKEGACPSKCVLPSTWYGGPIEAVYTVNGTSFSPDGVIDGTTGNKSRNYDPGPGGWNGKDALYQLNVTADARVRFSGCNNGGSGSFNGMAAIFDCEGTRIGSDDDGCGWGGMPRLTVDLTVAKQPYYVVVDGYGDNDSGAFGLGLSYR